MMTRRCSVRHAFTVATASLAAAATILLGTNAASAAASIEGWCDSNVRRDGSLSSTIPDPSFANSNREFRQELLSVSNVDKEIPHQDGDDEFVFSEEEDEYDDDSEEIDPSEWTVLEYWKLLNCDHVYRNNPRQPIHGPATWFYLRGMYAGLVAASASTSFSTDDEEEPVDLTHNNETEASALVVEKSLLHRRQQRKELLHEMAVSKVSWNETTARSVGFQRPVTVRHTAQRGRGVFAIEAIPEDTVVCVGGDEARFVDAQLYRDFVEMVPADLQCDILQFSYFDEEIIDGVNTDVILVALNDEAYLNADWTEDGSEANLIGIEDYNGYEVGSGDPSAAGESAARRRTGNGRRIEYVARRNIAAGEELLLKYSNFLYDDGWEVFGL